MPAGTTALTKTLDRICAIAAGESWIGAGRTFKGYKRFGDGENFDALVRALTAESQGYFWCAIKGVRGNGKLETATYIYAAKLYVRFNKDASSDLNAVWDKAYDLFEKLQDITSYVDGEFAPKITVALEKADAVQGMGIAVFDFGDGSAGGSMLSIDP